MTELSLNVLDIAQNSIVARARLIEISIEVNTVADTLTIDVTDDGCGMSDYQLERAVDPFYSTRTTRDIGLGLPFFKQAAEMTYGSFSIKSKVGFGTKVRALFRLSHIDRMPLGDINSTIHMLITLNTNIDFLYTYKVDDRMFQLDTKEFRQVLGNVPLDSTDISNYIKDYLSENKSEIDAGLEF